MQEVSDMSPALNGKKGLQEQKFNNGCEIYTDA